MFQQFINFGEGEYESAGGSRNDSKFLPNPADFRKITAIS